MFLSFCQVVIIDEAHNLSDTLSCIHSAELTGAQVSTLERTMYKVSAEIMHVPCDLLIRGASL